jgi:hypothetical protein
MIYFLFHLLRGIQLQHTPVVGGVYQKKELVDLLEK